MPRAKQQIPNRSAGPTRLLTTIPPPPFPFSLQSRNRAREEASSGSTQISSDGHAVKQAPWREKEAASIAVYGVCILIVEGVVERLEQLKEDVDGLDEEGVLEGVVGRDMVVVVVVDLREVVSRRVRR